MSARAAMQEERRRHAGGASAGHDARRRAWFRSLGPLLVPAAVGQDAPPAAARAVDLRAAEVVIPFELEGARPIPIVEAGVNGDGPVRFYFDTGASGCVLDAGFARELGLVALGKSDVGDPSGGGGLEAVQVEFDLTLEGAEWLGLPAVAFDRNRFGAGEDVFGVLGLSLARQHLLTVDYGAGRLRIADESLPEEGPGIVALFDGPLPEIELVVAGRPIRAHVDTGAPTGFSLPSSFVAGLELKSEPVVVGRGRTVTGEFEIKRAQLAGTLLLAGHAFTDPLIHINDRFDTANVGQEVLRGFVVSFDQRNRRARFAPVAQAAQGGAPPKSDRAAVRAELEELYDVWGRARVALDRDTIESILAPEFYVLLDGQEISRERFGRDVTAAGAGARLTRFDVDVLTVQRVHDGWTAVVTEKLEYELPGADGKPQKACSYWVTRDRCRKEGERWLVASSEALGYETWPAGSPPPFPDW